ncbi:MAG: binding-protein-dependent transporter inner rane component [Sphaerisporangium sp.]|nr:binding-protein-dependent transporter inner rane component [Sphaerisporangium sp.]
MRARLSSVFIILTTAVVWEVTGRLALVADGTFPSLTAIAEQIWRDRAEYPAHLAATFRTAGLGFLIGNAIALVLAVTFAVLPVTERLFRGLLVTLFCLPLVVVAPIVGIAFDGDTPKVVLAGLAVFFPTMVATLVGLRAVDGRTVDVVRSVGGGTWQVLVRVRLRSSLPGLLAGLRVAAPAAILGAMLGEFLGAPRGIGVFLLGSLGQADPARIWGIGLVVTAVAGIFYGAFAVLGRLALGASAGSSVFGNTPEELLGGGTDAESRGRLARTMNRMVMVLASLTVVLLAWYAFISLTGLPSMIVKSPLDMWRYLVSDQVATQHQHRLLSALGNTLPVAALGLFAGLAAAFLLATLLDLRPAAANALLPFALVSQTMPLVALTPLLVLLLGRGLPTALAVTMSVTFFPSYVTIAQGLASAPRGAVDVLHAVAAGPLVVLRKVTLPSALPYLFAATRLAAPRALLGVILAEQLASGTGVGGLLGEARGFLEYSMIWAVALAVAVVSVGLYWSVGTIEQRALRRFAGRS